ncbi:MAG: hypothetical protein QG601_251 [Pseudomonadota bacterium]|nr:hypothetical protein [Pseudomonadota bacterium]MDQ1342614.1 hypothetical protein [Pseudomonadota bacterium]
MRLGRLRAHVTRQWVILLLLPALAFRLLVPEGFMPAFGDGTELTMQMCHGDGKSSVIVRLTQDGGEAPDDSQAAHSAPCVFAAAATIAPPAADFAAPDFTARLEHLQTPRAVTAAPARHHHRPQSPRAPPSLV